MEAMRRGDQHGLFLFELQRCRMNLSACNTPKIKENCVLTPHPRKKFACGAQKVTLFQRSGAARPPEPDPSRKNVWYALLRACRTQRRHASRHVMRTGIACAVR